jgi:phosphoenolpyruvate synthase/pyruvate phosphate dikinase
METATATTLTIPLTEADMEALPLVGGKGAQLGVMLRGGLPVPEGFCVTTVAFRGGMTSTLEAEIAAAYEALGSGPVAVRSSATAEDLPEASFAGQQESFLNVRGRDAVVKAVRDCWQSLFTERAVAYRKDRGISDSDVAMAVVVQRMVAAEAAGVLFTLNPVTGALDELVIEAACGLGDQVVSARVTPDRYRLRRRVPHELIEAEGHETAGLLMAERLAQLGDLGLAAERLLGRAADIEWAFGWEAIGGAIPSEPLSPSFYLLQARAVTAAGPRLPEIRFGSRWNAEHCRGRLIYWGHHNLRENMPYPQTPFSRSFWNYLLQPHLGAAMGLLTPEDARNPDEAPCLMDLVDGRFYFNMNIMEGILPSRPRFLAVRMAQLVDAEAAEVFEEMFRTGWLKPIRRPRSLRRMWHALHRAPSGIGAASRRSAPERAWRAFRDCQEEVANFSRIDLRILNDEQVLAMARYFAAENIPRSVSALAVSFPALPALLYLSWALPRWGLTEALPQLRSGLQSNPTMETALAMWDLAEKAAPEVRAAILHEPISSLPEVLAQSPAGRDFLGHLEEFLKVHGHRAVREFDLSCPRWREDPTFVYETVRNYLGHPAGQPTPREHYARQVREHQEAKASVERALARRPLRRRIFRWLMRVVEDRLPLREANKFYGLMGVAHVRALYLEVGRRMVARGLLEKPDDFFFLSIPELERIAAGELDAAWIREQVPKRRLEFARHMRTNPPLIVRSDGKPVVKPSVAGPMLRGTPVSWGTAKGPARILLDPGDGALLEKGEVLVAPFTDPGWTPLFLTAGALVMETGGIMSHGAVVAREYGIPAVVGVRDATRVLRDGEIVEVDGATGEVRRSKGLVTSDS